MRADPCRSSRPRPRCGCSWPRRAGPAGRGGGARRSRSSARICRELDGLPLAIELAAARTSVLSVEEIEAHLADKFRFLALPRPAADPRHQALEAAIGWSYELLPEPERRGFRALSVFAGGLRPGAGGRGVLRRGPGRRAGPGGPAGQQVTLVAETAAGGTRYRLLETIRQYAAGRLAEAGEAEQARRRHAEAFLALAERERQLAVLAAASRTTSAPPWTGHWPQAARPGRGWPGRWAASGWPADSSRKDKAGWNARSPPDPADPRLRADLLRLLGAVLYAAGDPERARGHPGRRAPEIAAAAGAARGAGPDPGSAGRNPRHAERSRRRSARRMRGRRGGARSRR